ncbi:hypothetical protein [Bifidobacterium callitrichidarum]|uniref:Uncharacterized protein n=1 Tax=Bifidobacterium callitrichidarum TaxID=2052941 RepID=A0A2U2N7B0_9BIFI|nr:hypothetical protein [Bifidobacterium callitrichidarum]PWG65020.1 hypothetical protein DF196_07705 [Bifidobacterium callitrichidarum]
MEIANELDLLPNDIAVYEDHGVPRAFRVLCWTVTTPVQPVLSCGMPGERRGANAYDVLTPGEMAFVGGIRRGEARD